MLSFINPLQTYCLFIKPARLFHRSSLLLQAKLQFSSNPQNLFIIPHLLLQATIFFLPTTLNPRNLTHAQLRHCNFCFIKFLHQFFNIKVLLRYNFSLLFLQPLVLQVFIVFQGLILQIILFFFVFHCRLLYPIVEHTIILLHLYLSSSTHYCCFSFKNP